MKLSYKTVLPLQICHVGSFVYIYNIILISRSGKHILTACQDRNIRVYSVTGAKQTKTFKGSASEDGTLIKVNRFTVYTRTQSVHLYVQCTLLRTVYAVHLDYSVHLVLYCLVLQNSTHRQYYT